MADIVKFHKGDIVKWENSEDGWFTARCVKRSGLAGLSWDAKVVDPGTFCQFGETLKPGDEVSVVEGHSTLVERKPKKVRIQQLEAKLEEAVQDVAGVQRRLNEANRRYGKASKTIGELRGRLAQRALLAMAEPTSTLEPARLVTVGASWSPIPPPEPGLPVGSEVDDADGDRWTLLPDGDWEGVGGRLPWLQMLSNYYPLTLISFGSPPATTDALAA